MDPSQKSTPGPTPIAAFGIVGELGYIIAVPALLFGFGGAYIDKYFGTVPLFMMLGFLLALAVSALGVRNMIKRLLPPETKQFQGSTSTSK
jgi:F0F1-type ATP synthase assembly protein I